MYGWMQENIKQLVLRKYGKQTWHKILSEANLEEGSDGHADHYYSEQDSERLFKTVTIVTGLTMEQLFEAYGTFLVESTEKNERDELMLALGTDLKSFLDNMDAFHFFIDHTLFKNQLKPSFRTEANQDGSITLHYYSPRFGMYQIIQGMIKQISRQIFATEVTVIVVESKKERVNGLGYSHEEEHVVFRIERVVHNDFQRHKSITPTPGSPVKQNVGNRKLNLELNEFVGIFPYHVCFNQLLVVEHCGSQIEKLFPELIYHSSLLFDIMEIVTPQIPINFQNIVRYVNSTFVGQLRLGVRPEGQQICIKGQMILLENTTHIVFIASPYVMTIHDLVEKKLHMNDIPLHDATRDLVLLNQSVNAQMELNKHLEERTNELKLVTGELEKEMRKSDSLLKELLPANVADKLRRGQEVETRSFAECTILFADICSFTVICSQCKPMDVVDLLTDLYSKFDRLTMLHEVYKLITIGDGYVVAGGVPEECPDHAERICNLALGMVWKSQFVLTPRKERIQIRIGIHSGSLIGGIVGKKTPRYCLFGRTMSIASKMESSSSPSKIHVTETTMKLASRNSKFLFEERLSVNIKGNGQMMTYFLLKNTQRTLWDLINKPKGEDQSEDGYTELQQLSNQNYQPQVEQKNQKISLNDSTAPVEIQKFENNSPIPYNYKKLQVIIRYGNKDFSLCGCRV